MSESHCGKCNVEPLRIDESTRKELLGDMEARRQGRASQYAAIYQDTNPLDYTTYFIADGNKQTKWNQTVQLGEMKWLMKQKDLDIGQMVQLALTGDVKVFCNCPDYLYGGFKYMGTELDYNLGTKEKRFPSMRNPNLEGTVCKHLFRVLTQLPMHYPVIRKKLSEYWGPKLSKRR